MFQKEFPKFVDGLRELCVVSYSAGQALTQVGFAGPRDPRDADDPERQSIENLAVNVAFDRPTGNGVDWGRCSISITAKEVRYTTRGGLAFGWKVDHRDYGSYRERTPEGGNRWTFFIVHPLGSAPETSTLRASALAYGWMEKPVLHVRSPRLPTRRPPEFPGKPLSDYLNEVRGEGRKSK